MKHILLALSLFLLLAAPALAQDPAPGGGAIEVEPDPLPYTFAPFEYDEGGSEFATFTPFSAPTFINAMGSTVLTLFTLVDSQNVLAIFVVLLLAVWLLVKVYKFTVTSTPQGTIDLSSTDIDAAADFAYTSSNPYRRGRR